MSSIARTVDNIPYLCCVADTDKFCGSNSFEFRSWLSRSKEEYHQSDQLNYDNWAIDKYIPLVENNPKTELDYFTLPKVFKYTPKLNMKYFQKRIQELSMDVSINFKEKLILVL